jgi:hypothetical protein
MPWLFIHDVIQYIKPLQLGILRCFVIENSINLNTLQCNKGSFT